jgi:hypothetical protein
MAEPSDSPAYSLEATSARWRESKYDIDEKEHVSKLRQTGLEELCFALNEIWPAGSRLPLWHTLAELLGKGDSVARIERLKSVNPAFDLIKEWMTRPTSTVRVFKSALKYLKRQDLIDKLQELCRGTKRRGSRGALLNWLS